MTSTLKELYKVQKKIKELNEKEIGLLDKIDKSKPVEDKKYVLKKYEVPEEVVDSKRFFNILKQKYKDNETFKGKDPLDVVLRIAVISRRSAYTHLSDAELKRVVKTNMRATYKVEKKR